MSIDTNAGAAEQLLAEILDELGEHRIEHALVRDPSFDGRGQLEADVLVFRSDLRSTEQLLEARGFARRPAWGRRPHRFHVRPVRGPSGVGWLKIDLVTDLAFGPWHELRFGAGARCLARPDRPGDRLAPSDELVAQLLHGLLDGKGLGPRGRDRLQRLLPQATTPGALASWVGHDPDAWPTWDAVVRAIEKERWDELERMASAFDQRLATGHRVRVAGHRVANQITRRSVKGLTAVAGRGPAVALVGPDGTGKSTLAAGVAASLQVPVRVLYGGTYRSGTRHSRLPGVATATVAARLLGTRAQMIWHRSRGRLIVLDRHPMEARPVRGEGMSARARLRRGALASLLPSPDLLIALDAPAPLLHQRRPEHAVDELDRDRIRHLDLVARTAGATIIDASAPADEVRDRTVELVWARVMVNRSAA